VFVKYENFQIRLVKMSKDAFHIEYIFLKVLTLTRQLGKMRHSQADNI